MNARSGSIPIGDLRSRRERSREKKRGLEWLEVIPEA
jgi:hypothetical protein